jgi:hypothetical protein
VPNVIKSGSLNLLEPSRPVKACNGIALLYLHIVASAYAKAIHSLGQTWEYLGNYFEEFFLQKKIYVAMSSDRNTN